MSSAIAPAPNTYLMAASCASTTSLSPSKPRLTPLPSRASFLGLRSSSPLHSLCIASNKSFASQTAHARGIARTRCDANPALTISLSTGALLFLGRFVFLPFQRAQVAKAGLPKQNGVTHYEAGDSRAAEASAFLKTNDPAGFTVVDVLAWGALGHAIGFFILATASNGYDPQF